MGPQRIWGKPRKSGGPKGGAPKGGVPKISRFFFPLPPQFSLFLPSLGGDLAHFRVPAPSKSPPKFHEKTRNCGEKKKHEILGGPGEERSRGGREEQNKSKKRTKNRKKKGKLWKIRKTKEKPGNGKINRNEIEAMKNQILSTQLNYNYNYYF